MIKLTEKGIVQSNLSLTWQKIGFKIWQKSGTCDGLKQKSNDKFIHTSPY